MTSTPITSFQFFGALIVSCIGFLFRLGLEYKQLKKIPPIIEIATLAIFSFGVATLMFLYVIGKSISMEFKLIAICGASFFGSVVIPGIGAIKPTFFTGLMKDFLRKWVNGTYQNNQDENTITDTTTKEDTEMPKSEEDN